MLMFPFIIKGGFVLHLSSLSSSILFYFVLLRSSLPTAADDVVGLVWDFFYKLYQTVRPIIPHSLHGCLPFARQAFNGPW